MKNIEEGDVVKLKSGGPKMTVTSIGDFSSVAPSEEKCEAKCLWFIQGGEIKSHIFNLISLEKV